MQPRPWSRWIAALLLLVCLQAQAQHFGWQAQSNRVSKAGFYRIALGPELSSRLQPDFRDLRLFDAQGHEMPYLLKEEEAGKDAEVFVSYPFALSRKGRVTNLLISNTNQKLIDNISLLIRNAEARKKIRLTGSDDSLNWYVIKDQFWFESGINPQGGAEIRLLHFPPSTYRFIRLEIDDSSSAPLNIVQAGYYALAPGASARYTLLPMPKISQFNVRHTSRINISFPEREYVDRLTFYAYRGEDISLSRAQNDGWYLRHCRLYRLTDDKRAGRQRQLLQEFDLSSASDNTLSFPTDSLSRLQLEVDNEDDQPLVIQAVSAQQLTRYCLAWLEPEHDYFLRFGNAQIDAPRYDLRYFENRIPARTEIISTAEVQQAPVSTTMSKASALGNRILLWSGLGGIILLLGWLSMKMVRDMGQAKGE